MDARYFADLSLALIGADVTAEECNHFWKQYYSDIEIDENMLRMARDERKREDPSKLGYSKEGRAAVHLQYLLHQDYGRRAIVKAVSKMPLQELLQSVNCKLRIDVDLGKDPPEASCELLRQ